LLVRSGDAAALACALRRVIAEPALAMRLAAGARAVGGRLPDWQRSAERWEQALDLPAIFRRPSAL
jgi:glycosyltransferase involved in cell wall biosynthesis